MPSQLLILILACRNEVPPPDTGPWFDTPPQDTEVEPEPPQVVVNELMADNETMVPGDDGSYPDWLELYNADDAVADLSGYSISDDWIVKDKWVFPEGSTLEPGAYLLMWADGIEGDDHLPFRLNADGEGVGLFAPDGTALDWVVYPAQREDYAWTRIPDGVENWQRVLRGTPGSSNHWVERHVSSLVNRGDTWSYLDSGEYPGDDWTSPSFDDSDWASGPAPLGYGDYPATEVGWGDDESARHPTTWFRHDFEVPEGTGTSVDEANLALRVDDGAVVWLNGAELARQGMGEGEIAADSWAEISIYGDAEEDYTDHGFDPTLLVDGANILAIEVHQVSAASSDLTLDAELTTTTWVIVR